MVDKINEIFANPTIKEVIFQIRFPNLFFIESKIGEYQIKIFKLFPQSKLLFRKQLLIADIGNDVKLEDSNNTSKDNGKKIWQFISEGKYRLNITSDSLDITSEFHKTYKLENADRFRDIIEYAVSAFLEVLPIPTINRIGLRYIDECPLFEKNNDKLLNYYNTCFPTSRFDIKDADEMAFKTVLKRNDYKLTFVEYLEKKDEEYKLILDYDAFANNVKPENYLNVTDKLYDIITDEYFKSIKDTLVSYMRNKESKKL